MSNSNKIATADLEEQIYLIRGQRVMLDQDLASPYQVETRTLIQAVKRNRDRFPDDFLFSLSNQELSHLRSQFVISSWGGRRTAPYAFTEQGVAMLSSVLKSKRAVKVNIEIMRAFVQIRKFASSHEQLSKKLIKLEQQYDLRFKIIFDAIREIMKPENTSEKRKIGF